MGDGHASYPNPVIHEALCEIHFRLPPDAGWQPALPGELFKRIQSEFPTLEPITPVGFRLQLGPSEVDQAILPPQQRVRYTHASRNLLLQLSEGIFTVNELARYPGWNQMRADIVRYWANAREIIGPEGLSRIGLRYINRIERAYPGQTAGDWLAPSDYIAERALSSLPGFLSRLQARLDLERRLIVTVAEASELPEQQPKAIVLDIDCIVEREIDPGDDAVAREIEQLHELVWAVFCASGTPRLEQLLNKEV